MRSKSLVPSLAVLILGVVGCGSSRSSSTTSSTAALQAPGLSTGPGAVHIYRVTLSGAAETPAGAPSGAGDAVIAFHGGSVVCWRFSHLHGFADATFAHIHIGAKGVSGNVVEPLSTAPRLHHRGCRRMSATLVKAIEHSPPDYYVNIHSAQYPGGAVRAQL